MINGYSGCTIEFKDNAVIKSSTNYPSDRLKKQSEKQKEFSQIQYKNIKIPQIFSTYYINEIFYIEMQYFNAIDMIQFFNTKNINLIKSMWNTIYNFIQQNIKTSNFQYINKNIIINKYNSIKPNNEFDNIFYNLPQKILLPIGRCHGDLTLSNILYTNNNFILIDFLDSFIETPLIDIAKLRQDTKFFWSLLLYNKQYNKYRIKTIFEYLDNKIKNIIDSQMIKIFEILNLLRILPYCKTKKVKLYIEECLCQF